MFKIENENKIYEESKNLSFLLKERLRLDVDSKNHNIEKYNELIEMCDKLIIPKIKEMTPTMELIFKVVKNFKLVENFYKSIIKNITCQKYIL